jgi:acetoacetyl-CoA synthetase
MEIVVKKLLWNPSSERIKNANMTKFIGFINKLYNKNFSDYFSLYDWSIANIPNFWESVWNFLDINASEQYEKVIEDITQFPGTKWFPGAKLNFAENLLRFRDNRPALVSKLETRPSLTISYRELYNTVAQMAAALRNDGVTKDDRVVGYMPNIAETAVAMLAATSICSTWASCGSELGINAVIDRFSQIEPRVLFTVDGYFYKNKPFGMLKSVNAVRRLYPHLKE